MTWAGPPPEPTLSPALAPAAPWTVPKVLGPPKRSTTGTGLLAVGGSLKVLGLGVGISGIALGRGGPAVLLLLVSIVPSTLGGGLLVTGSWLRGRHQGWDATRDLSLRARSARRVGWPSFGVGLGLLVGTGVAIGASALTWSTTYGRARGYRLELQPTAGGLRLRF